MTFPWNVFPAGLFRGFFFTNPPFFRVLSPVAPAYAAAWVVIQSRGRLKQQTRKRLCRERDQPRSSSGRYRPRCAERMRASVFTRLWYRYGPTRSPGQSSRGLAPTRSWAPPRSGPFRAPIAEARPVYGWARVEGVTSG